MASSRVQALLERTKNLTKGAPDHKAQAVPPLPDPPIEPVPVRPLMPDSARDRSPSFASKDTVPAAAPVSRPSPPLMSIKERAATVLPQAKPVPARFSTPPKLEKSINRSGKPPKSTDRKPSPGRSLSVPKRQSSPGNRSFAEVVFEREKLPVLEQLLNEVSESRRSLQQQMQEQFMKEKQLIDMLKTAACKGDPKKHESPESQEQLTRIEESYKEKTQKLLSVVKEEVMVMDRKLADLLQENSRLKELIVTCIQASKVKTAEEKGGSRSSSRSGFSDKREKPLTASEAVLESMESQLKPTQESEYISHNDVQIKHLFSNLEQTSSTEAYRELCVLLAKKMIFERRHRLKTEIQARDMMDQQEKTISNLKDKVSQYDGRSSAQLSLRESPREEVHPFTEDSA